MGNNDHSQTTLYQVGYVTSNDYSLEKKERLLPPSPTRGQHKFTTLTDFVYLTNF
jgi:hypothetical protein